MTQTERPRRSPKRGLRRDLRAIVAGLVLGGVVVLVHSTSWLAAFGAGASGETLERMKKSPRWSDGVFHNAVETTTMMPGTLGQTLWDQLFGAEVRHPTAPIPVVLHGGADYAEAPASGLRLTWMGHATVLVEIEGRRVLLDPMWSHRASPSTIVGPTRHHPVPIALGALPRIDAVVISHDHYDHLDMATVKALAALGPRFFVPLGVGAHLLAWGITGDRVSELDWGDSAEHAGLTFAATPARHFSGRGLLDRDATLWSSWVIRGASRRVYFSGDTGWFDGFRQIGEEHGPFDVTIVKIGAYGASWPDIHVNPEQAVRAHVELRGKLLVPIHWATFNLAMHAWNEPAERAAAAARAEGVTIAIPQPGEMVDIAGPTPSRPWWQ